MRNPCDDLAKEDRPKVVKNTVTTIDATTTIEVLEAARPHRIFVPLVLGCL